MKITNLLTQVILEQGRFDVLYNKFVGDEKKPIKIPFQILKDFIFNDPTTRYPEGFDVENATKEGLRNSVKIGEYTNWIINRFINPKPDDFRIESDIPRDSEEYKNTLKAYQKLFLEDLYKVKEYLEFFHKSKKSGSFPYEKDINKLSVNDLKKINFEYVEGKEKESVKQAEKTKEGFKHEGGEIVFVGNDWTVIKISDTGQLGLSAAQYYGGYDEWKKGESHWCTSTRGGGHFPSYIQEGPLYVIFPHDDKGEVGQITGLPTERYQFHFEHNPPQFMDRMDNQIDVVKMFNGKFSELKEFFKPMFAKNLGIKKSNRMILELPGGEGSIIKIYSEIYDNLDNIIKNIFNDLPENLQQIKIENKDKNTNISIDIPESLTNLTNLTTIYFDNIVKSLPESMGNLKNLNSLVLLNNKQLKSLPKSLIKLVPKSHTRKHNEPQLMVVRLNNNGFTFEQTNLVNHYVHMGSDSYLANPKNE